MGLGRGPSARSSIIFTLRGQCRVKTEEKKRGGNCRTSSFVRVITDSYENHSIFHSKMFFFWVTHCVPRNIKVQVASQSLARMLVKDERYICFLRWEFPRIRLWMWDEEERRGHTHPDPVLFHFPSPFALGLGDQPSRDRNAVIPVTRKMYTSEEKVLFISHEIIFFFPDTQK